MTHKSGNEQGKRKFERMLADADELMRLRIRRGRDSNVRESTAGGLAAFLDAVLPKEAAAEERLARALHMDEDILRQLRRREIDPADVAPDALAILGRLAALDWVTFDTMVQRDLHWFATESPLAMLRDNTADPAEVRRALRAAWERDALDDAGSIVDDETR